MISIIGTVGVPACYGGFETLVDNLLDEKELDINIAVYCSSKIYKHKLTSYKNAQLHYIPLNANGSQSIFYDIWSIFHAAFKGSDHLLILGVSGAICLPVIRFFSKANVVTNIDGLEWKRDKWSNVIKCFLKFSEKIAIKYSDVVVADNKGISDYVKDEYGVQSKVIAYGGDHAIISELSSCDDDYALALCRIEPENNVEMILEAFSQTNKTIKFVGNWDKSTFGLLMKEKFEKFENIEIIDPIYDLQELFDLRQRCSFYVHGHSAGGTNPSLVEMMHFNKTIFAFDCNYNRYSTEESAGFFRGASELIELVSSLPLLDNGIKMKEIAKRRYTWDIVKQQYFNLFK